MVRSIYLLAVLLLSGPVAAQEIGLDAPLGVAMGDDLASAVATLRARGYRVIPSPESSNDPVEVGDRGWWFSSETADDGTTVLNNLILGREDDAPVATVMAQTRLSRGEAGIDYFVVLFSSWSEEGKTGLVFGLISLQDFTRAELPPDFLSIEDQLRQAAIVAPTCEAWQDGPVLIWMMSGALVQPLLPGGEDCDELAFRLPYAVHLPAYVESFLAPDSHSQEQEDVLLIGISSTGEQKGVSLLRVDTGLAQTTIHRAMQDALLGPSGGSAEVDF